MDSTQVAVVLAYAEIKGVCELISKWPQDDEAVLPGEKAMADHILGVMARHMAERGE